MRAPVVVPIEILKPYVVGKVFEYFSSFEKAPEAEGIHNYVNRTLEFVLPYLGCKEVLDARATDYQCSIAQSAYFEFKDMFEKHVLAITKKKSLEEAHVALTNLSFKPNSAIICMDLIEKAHMDLEHIREKEFSHQLRSLALSLKNSGEIKVSELVDKAATAFS